MARHAVIDIGTNSVKLLVGDLSAPEPNVVREVVKVTRLGEGLHPGGELSAAAMARTLDAVLAFFAEAVALGAVSVLPVGTMALRRASNAGDFVLALRERAGLALRVLSGEEEAGLSHAAAIASLRVSAGRLCVFDVGGGSTEFSAGTPGKGKGGSEECDTRVSVDLGCRRPTEQFLREDPPGAAALAALRSQVAETLAAALPDPGTVALLVGVGGTLTSLSSVARGAECFDPPNEHGAKLSRAAVEEQIERYASLTVAAIREIPGLEPERADVILTGAAIVAGVMERFSAAELMVSHRGLRYSLLRELCASGESVAD